MQGTGHSSGAIGESGKSIEEDLDKNLVVLVDFGG